MNAEKTTRSMAHELNNREVFGIHRFYYNKIMPLKKLSLSLQY